MSSVFEISNLYLDEHIRKATTKVDTEEYLKIRERFVNIVRTMDPTCPSIKFKWNYITIYKIYCKDPAITDIYIGSTNSYDSIKNMHICSCNKPQTSKGERPLYKFIRDHGGISNWDFEVLKNTYACNSIDEKSIKREYILKLKPTLNGSIPLRTRKERDDANREKINARQKELYHIKRLKNKSETFEIVNTDIID